MPWNEDSEATKHTHKAKSAKSKKQWRRVANSVLEKTGDEARAVRTANGVIKKSSGKKKSRKKVSRK